MARTGVSPGQRSESVFGWVQNLKKTKKAIGGLEDHQYQVSSLFVFFYALIRGRMLRFMNDFECMMENTDIPRNAPTNSKQFSLPFENEDITFQYQPLTPPEGYISRNFSRGIHSERCWQGTKGTLGECIGTWHWAVQMEISGLISERASSMRHMGSGLY